MSRTTSIGELAALGALQFGDGYRTKRGEHGQPGYRIIRVADVMDDAVSFEGPDFVSADYVRAIGAKLGHPGDILLTTKGTVGRVAVLPDTDEQVVYSPQLCYFRVLDSDVITPRFLRYWFSSQEFWNQAADRMNNTDMAAYINLADIRSLKMTLPSIPNQQAIAEVLGALDDKIAANTKLAVLGDTWIRSGFERLAADSMDVISLSELVRSRKESVKPTDLDEAIPYVGLEHIPRRLMWLGEIGESSDVSSNKRRFHAGDILFGKLRPYFHKVATTSTDGICSTDVLVLSPVADETAGFTLAALASDDVVKAVTASSEGTRMPRTSWKDLASVEVPWPGTDRAQAFSHDVLSLRALAVSAAAENLTLVTTRDALIPQLMSGKLRVKDAERVLEGAGV